MDAVGNFWPMSVVGCSCASVGATVAQDLGLAESALAADEMPRLTFGEIEPLVTLMEETSPGQLLGAVTSRLRSGVTLKQLISAAALANARAFGGQDYDGYHAMMALAPALAMSDELPEVQRLLPVFKVLYRNTSHIQGVGAADA